MKERGIIIKLIELITLIAIYYISGNNSLFLYASTITLYNIYASFFSQVTIEQTLKKYNNHYSKFKILKFTSLTIIAVCLLFVLLSILIGDSIHVFLGIQNTFRPFINMGLSVVTEPLITVLSEYLESYNKPKLSNSLLKTYYILESIFIIIIAIISISILKLPTHKAISLFYTSKILSFIIISSLIFIILNKENINFNTQTEDNKINYKNDIKEIFKNNSHKTITQIVKNSYYYISIIVLYMILSTRYSYGISIIENELTFIYLYGLTMINYLVYTVIYITNKKNNIISYILKIFKIMVTIAIISSITSPLLCKIIFGDSANSIYLMMISFLSIFISLFNITFDNIKNKKVIYISLVTGLISKIILIIPLINAFYRMGYNLIYGDIISTILSMSASITINYIYLKNKNKKEKTLEKILTTLYESIILCIILLILQFLIPIKTNNYFIALLIFTIYIAISIAFLKFTKKKRG